MSYFKTELTNTYADVYLIKVLICQNFREISIDMSRQMSLDVKEIFTI